MRRPCGRRNVASEELTVAPARQDTATDSDAIVEEVSTRLRAAGIALFGVLGPREALRELEAAAASARKLEDEEVRGRFLALIDAHEALTRGVSELRDDGDLEKARKWLRSAQRKTDTLLRTYPDAGESADFRLFQHGVELQLVEATLPSVDDPKERARLERRKAELSDAVMGATAFGRALGHYKRALGAFKNSTRALGTLDLPEARTQIGEARAAVEAMERELEKALAEDDSVGALASLTTMMRGFAPLFAAQENYVTVLHDAIVGEVRKQHEAMLEEADRLLREGKAQIAAGVPSLEQRMGALIGKFPLEELESAFEQLRLVFRNLRALVREGMRPAEVTRRSAPRLVVFFALSLAVIFGGFQLSGIEPEGGGTGLVPIVLIALVVAIGSSFGFEAMILFKDVLRWSSSGEKPSEPPPGRSK